MKKLIIYFLVIFISFGLGFIINPYIKSFYNKIKSNTETKNVVNILPKPLEKYSILELSNIDITNKLINIDESLSSNQNFSSYIFSINFDPTLKNKNDKKVTGLINIPNENKKMPVILMLRGYVDQKIYKTGIGTQKAGEYFANNGFITIAPDFLGYAGSDKETENIFESRFQTYTTALIVLNSLNSIQEWDNKNIFIWGHSNGGQIALTLLEITQDNIPTVLWAPVSKPFPYSILYYTDESDDLGKLIRRELSEFEKYYDVNNFSIHSYLDRINAPLEIHQGSLDDAVPIDWTNTLVNNLESLKKDVKYYKYQGADHNLKPFWNIATKRSLDFYMSYLK